jgi:phage-related minor tail protein
MAEIDDLTAQVASLEAALGQATGVLATFEGELARLQETMLFTAREVNTLSSGFGGGLRRAFDGVVLDGQRLSDALRGLAQSIASTFYGVALRPVQNALGGALARGINALAGGLLPFATGGGFTQGRVMPFAAGGIVSRPTLFPLRGGRGLMGEAGPEAILPLARGADGRLGVQAQGNARAVSVTINVSTPDVEGFRRSQSQIAAAAGRAIARGQRNR